jgi:hypothetical protein
MNTSDSDTNSIQPAAAEGNPAPPGDNPPPTPPPGDPPADLDARVAVLLARVEQLTHENLLLRQDLARERGWSQQVEETYEDLMARVEAGHRQAEQLTAERERIEAAVQRDQEIRKLAFRMLEEHRQQSQAEEARLLEVIQQRDASLADLAKQLERLRRRGRQTDQTIIDKGKEVHEELEKGRKLSRLAKLYGKARSTLRRWEQAYLSSLDQPPPA